MEFDLTQNLMHMVQIAEQNFFKNGLCESWGQWWEGIQMSFQNLSRMYAMRKKLSTFTWLDGCLCECAKWDEEKAEEAL